MTMMTLTSMFETHDKLQLVGILGITLSYIIAVIFNTLNGIGGKSIFTASSVILAVLEMPIFVLL